MTDIEEFKAIRKAFQASRKQFGKVFLGMSASQVYFYETGRTKPIPEKIMMLARQWKAFLDTMKGNKE